MTEQYLTTVLDEARQTIESHPQVGYGTEQPPHEHLRFAVLRLQENEAEDTTLQMGRCGQLAESGSGREN